MHPEVFKNKFATSTWEIANLVGSALNRPFVSHVYGGTPQAGISSLSTAEETDRPHKFNVTAILLPIHTWHWRQRGVGEKVSASVPCVVGQPISFRPRERRPAPTPSLERMLNSTGYVDQFRRSETALSQIHEACCVLATGRVPRRSAAPVARASSRSSTCPAASPLIPALPSPRN